MSNPIDIDRVEAVMLADGWHQVFPRTFDLADLEFIHATGKKVDKKVHDAGMSFLFSERTSSGEIQRVAGPVSSLLAVRYTRPSDDGGD